MNYHFSKPVFLQLSLMIIYKIALELSFSMMLVPLDETYYLDLNIFKYLNGWIWILIIFFIISLQEEKRVSRIILYLHIYIGLIPITVIYAFMNESMACFNAICIMYFFVALFNKLKFENFNLVTIESNKNSNLDLAYSVFRNMVVIISGVSVVLILVYAFVKNGLPTLTALNLSKVYEVRADYFISNKYIGYLYEIVNYAAIPFLIALCVEKRKYVSTIILMLVVLVLFLYSGNKTTLFSLIIILGVIFICHFKESDRVLFNLFTIGVLASIGTWIAVQKYSLYSIFVRRMLIVSAHLKFLHFNYFTDNPRIGWAGTLVGKFSGDNALAYKGYAFNETLNNAIGRVTLNRPDMGANTGFLIEGFDRFGFMGFFIIGVFFVLVLKAVDYMQSNTSYRFALMFSAYYFFALNDGYLLTSIGITSGAMILFVALFFRFKGTDEIVKENGAYI